MITTTASRGGVPLSPECCTETWSNSVLSMENGPWSFAPQAPTGARGTLVDFTTFARDAAGFGMGQARKG
ncbi:hypothetical protein, partial [Paracoccus liaowanqingii]|uniref:hypothetical protein n=1 Tax=Paracoccus liaowanqingii TaxID=2560053 RepID=UPI00197FB1C6